ncbi:MAG: S8 family serine peptidase [Nocardioidaceae bacterium]
MSLLRRVTSRCLLLSVILGGPTLATPAVEAAPGWASRIDTKLENNSTDLYLVLLRKPPLASYAGGVKGIRATAPRTGERFDAGRPSVAAYRSLLLDQQADVRAAAGQVFALYSYTTAVNGFAAELTASQVKQLGAMPEVLAVERSEKQRLAGWHQSGRDLPAAAAAPGIWSGVGGPAKAGHGVVVGVIDSGIWPDNPSFAGIPSGSAALARRYPGFTVSCDSAEQWTMADCNDKVVSARYFVAGFGTDNIAAAEYLSPRDGSGHGSHTAAIAAGNAGVSVQINDQQFGKIFGMAPGAGLAIYKACWVAPDPDDDGCTTADTVMAIDQAVSDGVDVLNYSIAAPDPDAQSPAVDPLTDAVDLAFLNAAAAGVFISTPAGDDGPGPSTVAYQTPWVTTVAAVSQPGYQGTVTLGNGVRITGAMVSNQRVGPTRLVDAGDVGSPTASRRHAERCFPGSLDASLIDGAIVVCERGAIARVSKSQAVNRAGGSAMVLTNRFSGVTNADLHSVPSVHVDRAGAAAIERYLTRSLTPSATMARVRDEPAAGRTIVDFSGRGPVTGDADVLKPDLAANGMSVLAAVAPPSNFGRLWDLYSGTSMSAPAVAGVAAMLAARHPDWSAAALKSALTTTARALVTGDGPLAQGAGMAAPQRMLDPGLVYDAGLPEWLGYLRGRGVSYGGGQQGRAVSGADLNLPSICISGLVGSDRVSRTVTNVSSRSETYVARVSGVRGVDVSVTPSSLLLAPGKSAEFTLTFTARMRAHYERFAAGTLTWRGSNGHRVTTPIVVRPQYLRAPDEVTAKGADRTTDLVARAGVTGTLRASLVGLVGAAPTNLALWPGGFDPEQPVASSSAVATSFAVPSSTAVARFALAAAHDGDDLDLFVYRGGELVASADSLAGDEQVTLVRPPSGVYEVYAVSSASNSTTGTTSTPAQLTGWLLPEGMRARAQVSPRPMQVTGGRLVDITVSWGALDESKRWFGYVMYAESGRRTYVTVD